MRTSWFEHSAPDGLLLFGSQFYGNQAPGKSLGYSTKHGISLLSVQEEKTAIPYPTTSYANYERTLQVHTGEAAHGISHHQARDGWQEGIHGTRPLEYCFFPQGPRQPSATAVVMLRSGPVYCTWYVLYTATKSSTGDNPALSGSFLSIACIPNLISADRM